MRSNGRLLPAQRHHLQSRLRLRVVQDHACPPEPEPGWLHVLKFGSLYEGRAGMVPETLKQEEGIEMALEGMRKARASDEVRELLELRRKAEHDEATRLERAVQEAERRGNLEGERKGERKALLDTARKMREKGIALETILEVTGLGVDDLKD